MRRDKQRGEVTPDSRPTSSTDLETSAGADWQAPNPLERAVPIQGEALREVGMSLETDIDSPRWQRSLNRVLAVQHPVVVAHVRQLRRRHPDYSPAQILRTLEKEYLAAVTTGGAAVGASAVIPGVGIAVSLALSGAETAYFLETSALYAQAVTEVHGIAVTDPERARTLVMAMMLGGPGAALVKQLAGEAIGSGPVRSAFWGDLVAKQMPKAAMSGMSDLVRKQFVKRFVRSQATSVVGRAIPFGIGAVIGGVGNHTLGRKVVTSSRSAFGPPPATFLPELDEGPVKGGRRKN
ncbi:hypothetical protein AX769_09350 [Frondihabitans sp. PAMC 28766]|uniref:hypothetical protein n=1 Tax=Frondihabitans sp. PAMC 28766 TaxID=1795630 RepID=UPI00078D620E|nr:hypothetical protein [Frondihabitans sp. PAMC 28766]AMM20329.1 hypothetical protein AX769_09350 [Frondihabitans sp. PAMC 28766]